MTESPELEYFIDAWNVRNDKQKIFGPFQGIQITYDLIRVDDDDEFAIYHPDCQANTPTEVSKSPDGWIFPEKFIASDFVIYAQLKGTKNGN